MPITPIFVFKKSFEFKEPEAWKGISGKTCYAVTTKGRHIKGWIPDSNLPPNKKYFCHGYALKTWKRNQFTIFSGEEVLKALQDEYIEVGKNEIQKGDVVSFYEGNEIKHTARIKIPNVKLSKTVVKTKNGMYPIKVCTLEVVMSDYPLTTSLKFWRPLEKIQFEFDEVDI